MQHTNKPEHPVVIIGAGPAGLTAAYQLAKAGVPSIVLEKDSMVGGISRTVKYKGYHFDIGGHRFFTKVQAVENLWREMLPEQDFLHRHRLSRIYYNRKFFFYPLRPANALRGLGLWNSLLIGISYLWAQLFPQTPEDNFERWVSNRFGKQLYRTFFKTYTEKVWGLPADQIAAEWAAQRIKGLSLLVAVRNALIKPDSKGRNVVKTLIDSFHYPKRGPGMMWEATAELIEKRGGRVRLNVAVERIHWTHNQVRNIEIRSGGERELLEGTHFISSMPIRELIHRLDPPAPEHVLQAAERLHYRDFLTVALIINKDDVFPDNWIYIHDPQVRVGRIQNFKNWSPYMVPDPTKTCLGLEYFCFEGDGLWTMADKDLIELAKEELEAIGLSQRRDIEDGMVVRMPKAYPVYDGTYREALDQIRRFLERFENLQVVGRNGMHKYNNQDHSMFTAMLAVENILGAGHDLWMVNTEQEYHEETVSRVAPPEPQVEALTATQPRVPVRALPSASDSLILTFAKMDKLAFATAVGSVSGLVTFMATLWLALKSGSPIGPHLELLQQFFAGYTVTVEGAFVGWAYSFFWAFLWGWLFAYLRNLSLGFVVYRAKRKVEMLTFREFLDHF
ncbi:MAG: FAD-dependent oxidoreductase [Nitrospiraceae bacterium]